MLLFEAHPHDFFPRVRIQRCGARRLPVTETAVVFVKVWRAEESVTEGVGRAAEEKAIEVRSRRRKFRNATDMDFPRTTLSRAKEST